MNPFLGSWIGPDEYTSEVQYVVSQTGETISVAAIDQSDGETAEVSDVCLNSDSLEFRARWPSTGRECSCIFRLLSEGQVELTFTYTDKALLVRKQA